MVAINKQVEVLCQPDEKISSVVAYTSDYMVCGSVVTKEIIRVSTWLRTNMAPETVLLHNAMVLLPGNANRPMNFSEINLPTGLITAFHIMPPAADPLDYDPNEAFRKMEPVTAMVGSFRMDGNLRMSQAADLKKYLEISRETFSALYDVTVSHTALSQMNLPKVSFVLVRQSVSAFGHRLILDIK